MRMKRTLITSYQQIAETITSQQMFECWIANREEAITKGKLLSQDYFEEASVFFKPHVPDPIDEMKHQFGLFSGFIISNVKESLTQANTALLNFANSTIPPNSSFYKSPSSSSSTPVLNQSTFSS